MLNLLRKVVRASYARSVISIVAVLAAAVMWPVQAQAQVTVSLAQRQSTVAPNVGRVSFTETYQNAYVGWRVTLTGGKTRSSLRDLTVTLTNTSDVTRPDVSLQELSALTNLGATCSTSNAVNVVTLNCRPSTGKTITVDAGAKVFVDLYYTSSKRINNLPTYGDCAARTRTGCLTLDASTTFRVGTSTTDSTSKAVPSRTSLGTYSLVGSSRDSSGAIVTSSPKLSVREFFTGAAKSASPSDFFTTTVIVPPEAGSTSVSVVESLIPKSNPVCVNFITYCYQSTVTVPPPNGISFSPQYLTVEVRADPSNVVVPAGSSLTAVQATVVLQYQIDGQTTWTSIGPCASPNTPNPPLNTASGPIYLPCWNARFIDGSGDLVWQFISYRNGGFRML